MKKCAQCKEIKSDEEFHIRKNTGKPYSYCKVCQRARTRKYRADNPEKYKKAASRNNKRAKHRASKRYSAYKNRALNRRKIPFELSIEEFKEITSLKCKYCNGFSTGVNYVGIDRIDSNKGYIIDNCVPCCDKCNFMKKEYSIEEFTQHIFKIASFYTK